MKDDRLQEALAALPRERASAGFTSAVLRRLDQPPARQGGWWLAAAALLALTLAGGLLVQRQAEAHRAAASAARILALQDEHRLLSRELDELAAIARQGRPALHLGGDEQVDLVLDLARLSELRSGVDSSSFRFAGNGNPISEPRPAAATTRHY